MKKKKTILLILDGFGLGKKTKKNPIFAASTPVLDSLYKKFPHSKLAASGEAVGLPKKVMGNSEVGHLNIGAGRCVAQDLVKINKACRDGSLAKNKILLEAMSKAKKNKRSLHFIGLVSDAGVHSHISHLVKMCEIANTQGVENIYVHALTDGRDTDPHSGYKYIKNLEKSLKPFNARVVSVIGRYFAMDRDKHWERIKKAYDLLVHGKGKKFKKASEAVLDSYANDVSDEFVTPRVITNEGDSLASRISKDDVVICFNFRTERLRQLTRALSQEDFPSYKMNVLKLNYYTLTEYGDFKNVKAIFVKENVNKSLGEILALNNLKQLRIAETEKYAHVTYFFSGGRDKLFKGEERILINSPRVATYDLQPEMSAYKINKAVITEIKKNKFDFICLNFANGDMVGHTGNFKAIVKAVEVIDACLGEIIETAKENYDILVTADHGNAEIALNEDGSINTAHSLNPVPLILVSEDYKNIKDGALCDIAPTILKIMGMQKPKEMTGKALI